MPSISDAITELTQAYLWEQFGDSVSAIVGECFIAVESWYSDMLVGMIAAFPIALPDGWIALDGSTYDDTDFPLLWPKIPAAWKTGSTFTLPDLDGVSLVGAGTNYTLLATGGASEHTLSESEMPAHTHTYTPPTLNIDLEAAGVPDIQAAGIGLSTNTGSTGSGSAHNNMPPYLAITWAIFTGSA